MEREELKKSSEARKTVLKNTEEELSRCVEDKNSLMEEARNNSGTSIDELVDKESLIIINKILNLTRSDSDNRCEVQRKDLSS